MTEQELKQGFIDKWKYQPAIGMGSAYFDCEEKLSADLDQLLADLEQSKWHTFAEEKPTPYSLIIVEYPPEARQIGEVIEYFPEVDEFQDGDSWAYIRSFMRQTL